MPIQCGLLELILFQIERRFASANQQYLECLYKAMFSLGYYGLMRIGEMTKSPHVVKACNIHIADNKDNILILLYSSKTQGKQHAPQSIKITTNSEEKGVFHRNRHFCPFELMREYLGLRGGYKDASEQFFIFRDGSPVGPQHMRTVLKDIITILGLDSALYGVHSLRIGRCTDLIKYNYDFNLVCRWGRWHSNVIYHYVRC